MSNKKECKTCEVCGDAALGVNFDAVCCESCKAFFRRNALKEKLVTCAYEGRCVIDLLKRRFCSCCRLQKCFKVGMKKDNILDDTAKKERMELVKLNRAKRLKTSDDVPAKKRKKKTPVAINKSEADSMEIRGAGMTLTLLTEASSDPTTSTTTSSTTSSLSGSVGAAVSGNSETGGVKIETSVDLLDYRLEDVSYADAPTEVGVDGRGSSKKRPYDVDEEDVCHEVAGAMDARGEGGAAATDGEEEVRRMLLGDSGFLNGNFDPKQFAAMGMPEGALTTMIAASLKSVAETCDPVSPPPSRRPNPASPIPVTNNIVEFSKYMDFNGDSKLYDETGELRELSDFEQSTIQQLVDFYDLTFTVNLEPLIHLRQTDPSLSQLVNQASVTVLRIIKFAKRVEEFPHLPQMTQIVALKSAWMQILLLRSVSLYDVTRNVWVTPKGDIPTGILKNATGFFQLHDSHVDYCKSFKELIKDDIMIIVIIVVIVLFSAKGVQPLSRRIISNIQDKYILLLKHYLEYKYGYQQSDYMMPELMVKIKELDLLADEHTTYLRGLNPLQVEPIMLEILNKDPTVH